MKHLLRAVLIAGAAAVGLSAQDNRDAQTVFRAVGDTVPVFVTVTDRSNRFVTTLGRDQFTVRDNGRVQPLTVFDNTPQPIRLVVLVDVSGSMHGNLPLIRASGRELFSKLGGDDLATVGTFGRDITIRPSFTRDEQALVSALPRAIEENAPTPLWRAIDRAMDAFGDAPGRRVVLVASDGKDGGGGRFGEKFIGHFEVVDRALRENVMIYAIAMSSRLPPGASPGGSLIDRMVAVMPDPGFGIAAEATGGAYVEIRARDNLDAIFARVVDELHSQYLLAFTPPVTDGKKHEVEVRLADRSLKARARQNYVAPKAAR